MQDDSTETREGETSVWTQEQFVGAVIKGASHLELHPKRFPKIIDLSQSKGSTTIGSRIDEVWRETEKDPNRRERAYFYKIDMEGKRLRMPKEMIVGSEEQVAIDVTLHGTADGATREYPAFSIHSL